MELENKIIRKQNKEVLRKLPIQTVAICERFADEPTSLWQAFFVHVPGLVSFGETYDAAMDAVAIKFADYFHSFSQVHDIVDIDTLADLYTLHHERRVFQVTLDQRGFLIEKHELNNLGQEQTTVRPVKDKPWTSESTERKSHINDLILQKIMIGVSRLAVSGLKKYINAKVDPTINLHRIDDYDKVYQLFEKKLQGNVQFEKLIKEILEQEEAEFSFEV